MSSVGFLFHCAIMIVCCLVGVINDDIKNSDSVENFFPRGDWGDSTHLEFFQTSELVRVFSVARETKTNLFNSF